MAAACDFGSPNLPPPSPPASNYHPSQPAHRGGAAVFSDWEFPSTFDMLSAAAEADLRAGSLSFAALWGLDPSLDPYPDLVREVPTLENGDVKVGGDGRTMSIDVKLVKGLMWSDGQPLTADDVVFTWQAICDSQTDAAATAGFDRIASMDVRSDSEVVWNFAPQPAGHCGSPAAIDSGVYAPYLQLGPVMWVMPKHRLEKIDHGAWTGDAFFAKPDVVSGPFQPTEVVADDHITYSANPHYADGRAAAGAYNDRTHAYFTHTPYLDKVVYKSYSSRDAMLNGLKAGETDVGFHLSAADVADLKSLTGSRTDVYAGLRQEFLNPNHGTNTATGKAPPWLASGGEDSAVLRALSLAIDRQKLVDATVNGAGRPSKGLFPSALTAYADSTLPGSGPDLKKAKQVLSDDGWAASNGVYTKGGRRLEFQLLAVCDSAEAAQELQLLKQEWSDLGASVTTDCRKRAPFFAAFPDKGVNATGGFDMSVYSNTWQADPGNWTAFGASAQIPSAAAPNGQNWNRCRNQALDADLATGESSLDTSKRRQAYAALARDWIAYGCTIPLFEWPQVVQVSDKLKNFASDPSISTDLWNAADWWVSG
jgi:peptide/nickel transport system substrate-binding protein